MKKALVILSIIFLTGCAGKDFVRPTLDEYKLGSTTYAQVIQKMEDPITTGEAISNGEKVKRIAYGYTQSAVGAVDMQTVPARTLAFFFHKDTLVGYEYISTFKIDCTDFDDSKRKDIVKGKTIKQEIIQLLGNPSSFYLFPISKDPAGNAIGYFYEAVKSNVPFGGRKYLKKSLMVSFDDKGIVSDIEYLTSGYIKQPEKQSDPNSIVGVIDREGSFIAYDNGTVLDTRTKLMWAAKDNGSDINWANAKSYCENYRGGGHTDWRMPTQDELAGLYASGVTAKNNPLIKLTWYYPWASETRGSEAAVFGFVYGKRLWYPQENIFSGNRALPVRSAK